MDKRTLLPVVIFVVLLVSVSLVSTQLARTISYGATGMWFLWLGLTRGRLAGIGVGMHLLIVAWRAGLLVFFADAEWWTAVHTVTIFASVVFVAADMSSDRYRGGIG